MTHRTERQHAVGLGQIRVPEGTTETTQVRTLLDPMDIAGALITADATHTCAETARYLVEHKHADYLLTIKGNRPSLHAAAVSAGRELINGEPGHVAEERGHGRISRWTTWTAAHGWNALAGSADDAAGAVEDEYCGRRRVTGLTGLESDVGGGDGCQRAVVVQVGGPS